MPSSLDKYQKKDLVTHIYDTPDTYVGGSDLIEEVLPILQRMNLFKQKHLNIFQHFIISLMKF